MATRTISESLYLQLQRDLNRLKEKVDVLAGDRGNAYRTEAAVRRSDMHPLASMKMQSRQTDGDGADWKYNALQQDVAAIYESIRLISNYIQKL